MSAARHIKCIEIMKESVRGRILFARNMLDFEFEALKLRNPTSKYFVVGVVAIQPLERIVIRSNGKFLCAKVHCEVSDSDENCITHKFVRGVITLRRVKFFRMVTDRTLISNRLYLQQYCIC